MKPLMLTAMLWLAFWTPLPAQSRGLTAEEQALGDRVATSFFALFVQIDEDAAVDAQRYAKALRKMLEAYQTDLIATRNAMPATGERNEHIRGVGQEWLALRGKVDASGRPALQNAFVRHADALEDFLTVYEEALAGSRSGRPLNASGGEASFQVPRDGNLPQLYSRAGAGQVIQMQGTQPHANLNRSGGSGAGGIPIIVRGPATLKMNPVGGSDTLSFKNSAPTRFVNLTLEPDDRAAVMFNTGRVYPGIQFMQCKIGLASGKGWNAETNQGFRGKWGVLSYELDDFLYEGGEVTGIGKEHCFYHHNPYARSPEADAIVIRDTHMRWAGRTAVQVVSRSHEGKSGRGNVRVEGCTIEDVCLEQGGGGSALTFRGGLNGVVFVSDTRVHLGGNPKLHPSVSKNITGALVMDIGSGAKTGTRGLIIDNCHFEVGPHFTGQGSARRPNVNISHVQGLRIAGTTIHNHPGAAPALTIQLPTIEKVVLDPDNVVIGDCQLAGIGAFKDPDHDGAGYRAMLDAIRAARKLPEDNKRGIQARKITILGDEEDDEAADGNASADDPAGEGGPGHRPGQPVNGKTRDGGR